MSKSLLQMQKLIDLHRTKASLVQREVGRLKGGSEGLCGKIYIFASDFGEIETSRRINPSVMLLA